MLRLPFSEIPRLLLEGNTSTKPQVKKRKKVPASAQNVACDPVVTKVNEITTIAFHGLLRTTVCYRFIFSHRKGQASKRGPSQKQRGSEPGLQRGSVGSGPKTGLETGTPASRCRPRLRPWAGLKRAPKPRVCVGGPWEASQGREDPPVPSGLFGCCFRLL